MTIVNDPSMEPLVLLYLDVIDDDSTYDASTPGIAEAVDLGEGTLADRVELLSALSDLDREGYIEERNETVDSLHSERNVYSLTDAGRERATTLREQARDSTVEVVTGGGVETTSLASIDDYLDDDHPLIAALARASDGRLVLDEEVTPAASGAFVNRTAELSWLRERVGTAESGVPQAATIVGEPGVGKTTLLDELEAEVTDRGGTVLRGRCRREVDRPYQAVFELLEGLPDRVADRLRALLSERDTTGIEDAESLSAQRSELFTLVADRIESLSVDPPIVFAFDDIQWMDPTTAALLAGVSAAVDDAPILLVCTCRATAWSDESVPEQLAGPLTAPDAVLELERFDREATTTLVSRLLGIDAAPEQFVENVYELTGGNPLFITESVTKMLETGTVDPALDEYPETSAQLHVPDAVEATIDSRFADLDDRTRELLDIGSLVGDTMDKSVLQAATTLDEPSFLDCAGILLGSDVWSFDSDARLFRFESGVVRERVRAQLSDERARDLHRRIATAYQEVQDEVDAGAATIARHYREAGALSAALESYLDAAADAEAVYAQETAIETYEQALSVARSLEDESAIITILERTGDAHAVLGAYDDARECFSTVLDRTDGGTAHQRMHRKIAETYEKQGQYDKLLDHVERGLAGADAVESRAELPALLSTKASALGLTGDRDAALDAADRAASIAEAIGDNLARARALRVAGTIHRQHGEIDEARTTLEQAAALVQSTDDPRVKAGILKELGTTNLRAGGYTEALSAYDDCYALYEDAGDRHGQCAIHNNRGVIYHYLEDLAAAKREYEHGIEIAERIGDKQGLAKFYVNLGYIEATLGNFDAALEWAAKTEASCSEIGDRNGLVSAHEVRAEVALYRGAVDRSRDEIEQAIEIATETDDKNRLTGSLYLRGRIELAAGETAAAIDTFEEAIDIALEHGIDQKATLNRFGLVQAFLQADRVEDAGELLERIEETDTVTWDTLPPKVSYAIHTGAYGRAAQLIEDGLDHARDGEQTPLSGRLLYERAHLAVARGDSDVAQRIDDASEFAADAELGLFVEWCDRLREQL